MARLGAYVSDYLRSAGVDDYLRECIDQRYRAAPAPPVDPSDSVAIRYIRSEFEKADIRIAETTAWVRHARSRSSRSVPGKDTGGRSARSRRRTRRSLLHDRFGVVRSGGHAGFARRSPTSELHLRSSRRRRGVGPWSSDRSETDAQLSHPRDDSLGSRRQAPDVYLEVLRRVDHAGLAVHLDPANSLTSPHRAVQLAGDHRRPL